MISNPGKNIEYIFCRKKIDMANSEGHNKMGSQYIPTGLHKLDWSHKSKVLNSQIC